jgi:hypothetical protein
LEAKIISRGAGRSAVAAAAYMSCSKIENDYDGILHDYTRKGGLVYEHIYLPETAPKEWQERSVLWNAVEAAEKTKDSRLAREFILALPVECALPEWTAQVEEFAKALTDDGMCADVCIHNTDGHNPHAHILTTVRPLNPDGTWQKKTEKEYLCVKDGEERGFTAAEFQAAQNDGWERQYLYYVNEKKEYLPPSQAEGLQRINKYPKSTRYGRQNPISARWNSEEQLLAWRKLWAEIVNRALEEKQLFERVDHRSFAERDITLQPTIHEGVSAKAMNGKGKTSDRAEINRLIRADNKLIQALHEQVHNLIEAIRHSLFNLAETLETLRINLISLDFRRRTVRGKRTDAEDYVSGMGCFLQGTDALLEQIQEKETELKAKEKKLKHTLKMMKNMRGTLLAEKAKLHMDIDELDFELRKTLYLMNADTKDDLPGIREEIERKRSIIPPLQKEESKLKAELEQTLSAYRETERQSVHFDPDLLLARRQRLRPKKEQDARKELCQPGDEYNARRFNASVDAVSEMIGEEPPHYLTEQEHRQREAYERHVREAEERKRALAERRKQRPVPTKRREDRDER